MVRVSDGDRIGWDGDIRVRPTVQVVFMYL